MAKTAEFSSARPNLVMPEVKDVTPEELAEKMEQVHVIDVRGQDEFVGELGHIPGAKLMTLDTLLDHLDELPTDETVVFVCRSGGRSAKATSMALRHGLSHVYNMSGGMIAWNEKSFKTEH